MLNGLIVPTLIINSCWTTYRESGVDCETLQGNPSWSASFLNASDIDQVRLPHRHVEVEANSQSSSVLVTATVGFPPGHR